MSRAMQARKSIPNGEGTKMAAKIPGARFGSIELGKASTDPSESFVG